MQKYNLKILNKNIAHTSAYNEYNVHNSKFNSLFSGKFNKNISVDGNASELFYVHCKKVYKCFECF